MLLAQISDLHVRPTGERYKDAVDSNRMFADAVEHLNRLDPQPDVVLITGDLVDEGLAAEYDSLRALLGGLELPCLLIPGNHDDRERLALFFSEHAYLPASGPKHSAFVVPPNPPASESRRPACCIGGATASWSRTRAISAVSKGRIPSREVSAVAIRGGMR